MASLGSLAVSLVAQTGKFNKDLTKSRNVVKDFGGMASKALAALPFAAAAMGVAALATAFGVLAAQTRKAFVNLDAANKSARRLGIDLETLRGIQFGAGLSGSADEAIPAMDNLNNAIGAGLSGNAKALKTFDMLGINMEELAASTPTERLYLVSDALASIEDPAQKAFLANKLLGSSSKGVIDLFAQGRGAIQGYVRELQGLQGKTSGVDANQIEMANDAYTRMTSALEGMGNQIAQRIAPYLQMSYENVTSILSAINGPEGKWIYDVAEIILWVGSTGLSMIIQKTQAVWNIMEIIFNGISAAISGIIWAIAAIVKEITNAMQSIITPIVTALRAVGMNDMANGLESSMTSVQGTVQGIKDTMGGMTGGFFAGAKQDAKELGSILADGPLAMQNRLDEIHRQAADASAIANTNTSKQVQGQRNTLMDMVQMYQEIGKKTKAAADEFTAGKQSAMDTYTQERQKEIEDEAKAKQDKDISAAKRGAGILSAGLSIEGLMNGGRSDEDTESKAQTKYLETIAKLMKTAQDKIVLA